MAISAKTEHDVRTTGSDTNGGGFVSGASGTDWSQQNSPQYSVTDGVTNGTTTITSATASFGTDVVGNLIYVQGGTGSITAGWYEIISRTNSTTIVVDRSTGLTTGTGVTLHIGGALLTIAQAVTNAVACNKVHIKSGTYTLTATQVISIGGTASAGPIRYEGYGSTHEDLGTKPLITTATNSVHIFTITNASYTTWKNLSLSSTAGTRGDGFRTNSSSPAYFYMAYCVLDGFEHGIYFDHNVVWQVFGVIAVNSTFKNCNYGLVSSQGIMASHCYFKSNTTAGSANAAAAGVALNAYFNCVFYGNGTGLDIGRALGGLNSGGQTYQAIGCVFSDNTYGIRFANSNSNILPVTLYNNIFYNNATNDVDNPNTTPNNLGFVKATSFKNAYNGTSTNWYTMEISLSGDPFNGRTSDDFSLNNTAGAGALLRAAGFSGTIFGTGYNDVGPLQHQDSGGGGGSLMVNPKMTGGMQ